MPRGSHDVVPIGARIPPRKLHDHYLFTISLVRRKDRERTATVRDITVRDNARGPGLVQSWLALWLRAFVLIHKSAFLTKAG